MKLYHLKLIRNYTILTISLLALSIFLSSCGSETELTDGDACGGAQGLFGTWVTTAHGGPWNVPVQQQTNAYTFELGSDCKGYSNFCSYEFEYRVTDDSTVALKVFNSTEANGCLKLNSPSNKYHLCQYKYDKSEITIYWNTCVDELKGGVGDMTMKPN